MTRSAGVPYGLASFVLLLGTAGLAQAGPPVSIRIGLSGTLFQDVPKPLVMVSMMPFKALMEAQTGVGGEMAAVDDAGLLADQLHSGAVELAVFHGVEFAWARHKHAALKPLALAVNEHRDVYAYILVRRDAEAGSVADLRGRSLAMPTGSRLWSRLFLNRHCQDPRHHFGTLTTPVSIEEALDDVVDGAVDAAVADGVALECYQRRKPARSAQMRVLHKSEKFPTVVIAYRGGKVDETTLQRFRNGLIGASQSVAGRQVLTLWRMTAFEPIPADYDQTLLDIVKTYPPPTKKNQTPSDTLQAKKSP